MYQYVEHCIPHGPHLLIIKGLTLYHFINSFTTKTKKKTQKTKKHHQTNKKIHFIKTTFQNVDLRELNLTRPLKIELCTVRRLNEFSISIYCNLLPPNKNGSFPGQLKLS